MLKIVRWIGYRIKRKIREIFDHDPMEVLPYISYSNGQKVHVKGRVLENEGIIKIEKTTMWENFKNSIKSFESDEAKNAKVIITYNEKIIETCTDNDGYFEVIFDVDQTPTTGDYITWDTATVIAPQYLDDFGEPIQNQVQIMLPHQDTENMIVSDIDDTILISKVNSFLKLKLIYKTLFKSAFTRLPFDEMPQVLRQLILNRKGQPVNPIFYLSHSPWNLYTFLLNFFKFHDIPLGPLFLRDFGIKFGEEYVKFKNHKRLTLEHLLEFYHDKRFILLGDATEGDTEIYLAIYRQYPERVRHIYIREDNSKMNKYVRNIIKNNPEVPIHLIKHSSDIIHFHNLNRE